MASARDSEASQALRALLSIGEPTVGSDHPPTPSAAIPNRTDNGLAAMLQHMSLASGAAAGSKGGLPEQRKEPVGGARMPPGLPPGLMLESTFGDASPARQSDPLPGAGLPALSPDKELPLPSLLPVSSNGNRMHSSPQRRLFERGLEDGRSSGEAGVRLEQTPLSNVLGLPNMLQPTSNQLEQDPQPNPALGADLSMLLMSSQQQAQPALHTQVPLDGWPAARPVHQWAHAATQSSVFPGSPLSARAIDVEQAGAAMPAQPTETRMSPELLLMSQLHRVREQQELVYAQLQALQALPPAQLQAQAMHYAQNMNLYSRLHAESQRLNALLQTSQTAIQWPKLPPQPTSSRQIGLGTSVQHNTVAQLVPQQDEARRLSYREQLLHQRERMHQLRRRPVGRLNQSPSYFLSLTAAIEALVAELSPGDDDAETRRSLLARLQVHADEVAPGSRLQMFGSSVSGLHSKGADLDLTLVTEAGAPDPPIDTQRAMIRSLAAIITVAGEMKSVNARPNARVPIVALEDGISGLSCDICMCNKLALFNSQLIKAYTSFDPRVRQLCLVVKRWAKRRCIADPYRGSPSSYAWVLLVINYLQMTWPPVLPVLQAIRGGAWGPSPEAMSATTHDGRSFDCSFCADILNLRSEMEAIGQNSQSSGELLCGFFRCYAREFDFKGGVVSVRTGSHLSKHEKGWTTKERGFRGDRHLFCIEDPFELTHDLGRVCDPETLAEVKQEIARAFQLASNEASLEELCEPWREHTHVAKPAIAKPGK